MHHAGATRTGEPGVENSDENLHRVEQAGAAADAGQRSRDGAAQNRNPDDSPLLSKDLGAASEGDSCKTGEGFRDRPEAHWPNQQSFAGNQSSERRRKAS